MKKRSDYTAVLVFSDGTAFPGYGIGAKGDALGELCFNTGMTGYQEILTDPSYAGQIINFTFPHIGNVGVNGEDYESRAIFASGLIMREDITNPSSFRAEDHLNDWLINNNITGICGVDTRAITRMIRIKGAMSAVIRHSASLNLAEDKLKLQEKARSHPGLSGLDLASRVSVEKPYEWIMGAWGHGGQRHKTGVRHKVIALDFGEKLNILRLLKSTGADVHVMPASTTFDEIIGMNADGVFLSNGPADPEPVSKYTSEVINKIIAANIPLFGICLGFQLIALALGAKTRKMSLGHRGGNQPVKNLETGQVEITSQNHGFEVLADTLPANALVTHVSLFDGSLEGFRLKDKPVMAVQYHPEASPGPHDSQYLFQVFADLMRQKAPQARSKHC